MASLCRSGAAMRLAQTAIAVIHSCLQDTMARRV
jgi:hypothetical protein